MKLVRCDGGGEAKVQYDPGSGELSLGTNGPFVWDAEDIVKIWTLDLGTLSEYLLPDYVFTIRLDVSGNAELNAGAICPPEGEEDEVCLGRGEVAGVFSEDSTWAFRGDAGPYGIVVWSDNEKSATFSIITR
jgi:hypothetical protein